MNHIPPNPFLESYCKMDFLTNYNCVSTFLDRHIEEGRGGNITIRHGDETITYAQILQRTSSMGIKL